MLKKEKVLELYKKHKSKRKVAQILKVSRQYVIQVIKDYDRQPQNVQKMR